jgi:hypothetical protein
VLEVCDGSRTTHNEGQESMSEEKSRPKGHMTAAMVGQRAKTMENFRFLMDYGITTYRSAVIPAARNGMPAETFAKSVEFGIVWEPDPECRGRLTIKRPFDLVHDDQGTAYIMQWEGPVGP